MSTDDTPDRVMIDIETLGTEPGAAIIAIGAVRFDRSGPGEEFYKSVSIKSCQEHGLEIDAGTLEWWLGQDDAAREQLAGGDALPEVLWQLDEFVDGADEVWACSPSFDCKLLASAFDAVGLTEPWMYYELRDYRTVRELPIAGEMDQDGADHDALADAKLQALVAAKALDDINRAAQSEVAGR